MRICVYTTRRLQWIVIDCKRKLQQDKGYCTKKILSVHILQVPPHIKIGCTVVRLTWEDHWLSLFHPEEFDEQAAITGLTVLTWLLLNPRAQRYFLTFKFGVPRDVRCTWTKWQWKLVHSPYQHPSRTMSSKLWDRKGVPQHSTYLQDQMNLSLTGLRVLIMNSQLLFADSLSSTLLDLLG